VYSASNYLGGCQCGKVRYKISSVPYVAYCCHCRDCQAQSSSAFGISVWFPSSEFLITHGKLATYVFALKSGDEKLCAYCADCGTRIYHTGTDDTAILSVKGGSLDAIHLIKPSGHIWMDSALDWVRQCDLNGLIYPQQPDSFDELIARFQPPVHG